jgi:methionyl-tRNA formyltransferase
VKIFFIGSVEFSRMMLQKLINMRAIIVGVAAKKESSFNSDFVDIADVCRQHSIPCRYIQNINALETVQWISELKPDIIFCFGWSNLLKKDVLGAAPMGVVGFHPAKLPANRGRHPLIWALALGLNETASTFFFMDEGADSGNILSQKIVSIDRSDDAASLYQKITDAALLQIGEFVPHLKNRTYKAIPQNHALSNSWRRRGRIDGQIDFRMSGETIFNLVRALTKPYVGAHIYYKGEDIKVWKVKPIPHDQQNTEYGKIVATHNNILTVRTADGAVEILNHDFKTLPQPGEYL